MTTEKFPGISYYEVMLESHQTGERISALIEAVAQILVESKDFSPKDQKRVLKLLWKAQDEVQKLEDGK